MNTLKNVISNLTLPAILPYLLLVLSGIGLIASFALTYDKIQTLKDPSYESACSMNPVLSCGSVMKTEQASLLGVPNTIFGVMGYTGLAALSVALLAGAQFKRWLWIAIQIGVAVGVVFMHYLFFQGVFRINAICPYCFVVWMITIPIFWYTTLYNLRAGHIHLKGRATSVGEFVQRHHGDVLIVWYMIIFSILLQHFWYYWKTLI